MADISSITSLITSFRSETREEAITPEVLGALLQKIADLLGKAALQTDVSALIIGARLLDASAMC